MTTPNEYNAEKPFPIWYTPQEFHEADVRWECDVCGASVINTGRHNWWHQVMEDAWRELKSPRQGDTST